jgi:putative spermidine/putrescine transport system ATP-binding protein
MIAGHESITDGDILIGQRNVTRAQPATRGTAMVFQSYALFPHLSALDNVAFSLKMRGVAKDARRKRAGELLELVEMSAFAERKPSQLSG